MLWFERQVVTALVSGLEDQHRTAVVDYVEGALRAMPEHLRAGVVGESVLFGGWARVRRALRRTPPLGPNADIAAELRSLEGSPLVLVRQYVRLLQSLVLFAQFELSPDRST